MCGICGIVHADRQRPVSQSLVAAMSDAISHRGPDDSGLICRGNGGMGHRRLSIIDVAGGKQPIYNEDGTLWLVYNGELYNYKALREDLKQKGHIFTTQSDTEVILHAYEEYGPKCLQFFRGMFAFAIYDEQRSRLFLARDRIGIKPLYYTLVDNSIYFGSEIKALLSSELVRRDIDESALYHYFRMRYVPGPRTIFNNIFKLQPGHWLLYEAGELQIKQYWDLNAAAPQQLADDSLEGLAEQFTSLLDESVRIRMMSEVPLGGFLSGGLDSSVIVALMDRHNNGRPVKTFSVGYEQDYGVNEFSYARMVAERYRTEHYECRVSPGSFYDFLPNFVWYLDEPIADSASIPLYFLSAFAKEHVTVVLSGEGADEVMAGYGIYQKMLQLESLRRLPAALRNSLAALAGNVFFAESKMKKYFDMLRYPLENRYKGVSLAFSPDSLSRSGLAPGDNEQQLEKVYADCFAATTGRSPLNRMMYTDLQTWLPDDLLMKADKMTMAAGQELRVPFLDHKMVEFCYSLPQAAKIHGKESKYLLRKLGQALLPQEVVTRSKKGFPVPIRKWFEQELSKVARETLTASSSFCRTFFPVADVTRWLEEHDSGRSDNSEIIWNLLVIEFWHREFISHPRKMAGGKGC